MSVRRHIITGEPILFAPGRAARPHAFGRNNGDERCPFCPGNESDTPPEIARSGDPWRVRVFPNKYPAVDGHEVIVEAPQHDAMFSGIGDAGEVVRVYIERYSAHSKAAYVSLFKNHGERGGASLDHLHSQLMPLPFVPPRIAIQAAAFSAAAACPLCDAIDLHARENLGLFDNGTWVAIAPYGSQHAYEQWLIPRRHQSDIAGLDAEEIDGLGAALQESTGRATEIAASHNVLFMNFPPSASAHVYVTVMPRMTPIAGFELATGTFIDIIDPAAAARRLR